MGIQTKFKPLLQVVKITRQVLFYSMTKFSSQTINKLIQKKNRVNTKPGWSD